MKRKAWVIVTIFAGVFIVLVAGLSAFLGLQVFYASTQLVTNQETAGLSQVFSQKFGDLRGQHYVEELRIASSFGEHMVPADYLYALDSQRSKDHQTVILVHGLGGNRYSNYPLAEYFLAKGFNVITYDQRSSNENTAKYTTFGYWEKYDLIDWVNYVKQQAPGKVLGIWGASFGGATAGLALGHGNMAEKISFLILDCPVSSMKWMVEEEMSNMEIGIPVSYLTWCGNVVNKVKLGFTYQDADVPKALENVRTPVLVINSKVDKITPYFMGKDIYDAILGINREIWTVDDSEHCEIWSDYNQEYRAKMDNFITNQI